MATVYFVTHPEVVIDPAVPVPDWGLSDRGFARIRAFCGRPELSGITRAFVSDERKALDCAQAFRTARGIAYTVDARLRENDRSATGYVAPPRFWEIVAEFFARPQESILGWERAIDAQSRIRAGVEAAIAATPSGDLAVFAHGGVGTLLLCHLMGAPIAMAQGQPIGGGGCYFAFDAATRRLQHGWRDIVPAS